MNSCCSIGIARFGAFLFCASFPTFSPYLYKPPSYPTQTVSVATQTVNSPHLLIIKGPLNHVSNTPITPNQQPSPTISNISFLSTSSTLSLPLSPPFSRAYTSTHLHSNTPKRNASPTPQKPQFKTPPTPCTETPMHKTAILPTPHLGSSITEPLPLKLLPSQNGNFHP